MTIDTELALDAIHASLVGLPAAFVWFAAFLLVGLAGVWMLWCFAWGMGEALGAAADTIKRWLAEVNAPMDWECKQEGTSSTNGCGGDCNQGRRACNCRRTA
jgi:hypothetical protein